jgi:radical SAM protein with 4Fe4S-binding SPASM domain
MEAAIVVTYRCNARCAMCGTWKHPTRREAEFTPNLLKKLPALAFANVTGGEPFLREDLAEIVSVLSERSSRIVISTNGYFTDRVLALSDRFPAVGIRISLEGLPAANDELRGLPDGFDHGLRTLLELQRRGRKDIGFGITVSDRNAEDLLELYELARAMQLEFATAVVHNSYYFHKHDNVIHDPEKVIRCFEELVRRLLRSRRTKEWFRAYFNYGLTNYIRGHPRLLPCAAGDDMFFVDPAGEIRPCNGLEEESDASSMGNLRSLSFDEIWNGERARAIRERLRSCPRRCWMIGTASPAMKREIAKPLRWIFRNKIRLMMGREIKF